MDSLPPPLDSTVVASNASFPMVIMQDNAHSGTEGHAFLLQYALHEINAMLWALLIVVTAMLLKRLGQLMLLWLKGSRLPGPPSPAFAGHASCIAKAGGPNSFTEYLSKLHKEYGPIVRLWLGPTQLLVSVKDRDLIGDLLIHAKDRAPTTGKALHLAFGRGSVFAGSNTQPEKRRSLFFEEFNGKLIGRAHTICQKVIGHLEDFTKEGTASSELDCKSVCHRLAFRVLGTALFGDTFLAWHSADEFIKILLLISKEACFWATYTAMPFWNKKFQEYKRNCCRLQELTEEIMAMSRLQQHHILVQRQRNDVCAEPCFVNLNAGITMMYDGSAANLAEDMISGLIAGSEWSRTFNATVELRGSLIGLMFHGGLTTAGILSGALTRLAQNQTIQAKVHAEVDNVCKSRSPPTADDVKNMHYLVAVLHESARLLPTGPLLQRCSLVHDLKLSGTITVPAGAILAIPVQLVQMDVRHWGQDAEVFSPERFLYKDSYSQAQFPHDERSVSVEGHAKEWQGDFVNGRETENLKEKLQASDTGQNMATVNAGNPVFKDPSGNPSFLLFGAGSRACVGKNFASIAMTTLLATLLQRFKVELAPGAVKELKPMIENCILHLSPSPKLIFEPRHHY